MGTGDGAPPPAALPGWEERPPSARQAPLATGPHPEATWRLSATASHPLNTQKGILITQDIPRVLELLCQKPGRRPIGISYITVPFKGHILHRIKIFAPTPSCEKKVLLPVSVSTIK